MPPKPTHQQLFIDRETLEPTRILVYLGEDLEKAQETQEAGCCPFCGHTRPILHDITELADSSSAKYAVICDNCSCIGPLASNKHHAILRWNLAQRRHHCIVNQTSIVLPDYLAPIFDAVLDVRPTEEVLQEFLYQRMNELKTALNPLEANLV